MSRLQAYHQLNQANEQALTALALTTTNKIEPAGGIKQVCASLDRMLDSVLTVMTSTSPHYESDDYKGKLAEAVAGIKRKAQYVVTMPVAPKGKQHTISPAIFQKCMTMNLEQLTALDERLSGAFSKEDITVEELATLHDAIRYLHEAGTVAFFDPAGWGVKSVLSEFQKRQFYHKIQQIQHPSELSYTIFNITIYNLTELEIDTLCQDNPYFNQLDDIVQTERFAKLDGSNEIDGLAEENKLSLNLLLGCHRATLYAQYAEGEYSIRFRFTDTTCDTSRFRTEFVKHILTDLGYSIDHQQNMVTGRVKTTTEAEARSLFEETFRLAVSTKNLDILSMGNNAAFKRMDDLVKAFAAGVLPLRKYLCESAVGEYDIFPDKVKGKELPSEMMCPEPQQAETQTSKVSKDTPKISWNWKDFLPRYYPGEGKTIAFGSLFFFVVGAVIRGSIAGYDFVDTAHFSLPDEPPIHSVELIEQDSKGNSELSWEGVQEVFDHFKQEIRYNEKLGKKIKWDSAPPGGIR